MTCTEQFWMTSEMHAQLEAELAELQSRPGIQLPEDFMDTDENLIAKYAARQAPIREVRDLLSNAVVSEAASDDGVAEPGMVLTVRYDDTGEVITFLFGVRCAQDAKDAKDVDVDVYSTQSPLGKAIAGARVGEQRVYSIPSAANVPVTLLSAAPYRVHAPSSRTSECPTQQHPHADRN